MSNAKASVLLRHIRHLAGVCGADPLADRELLRRFATLGDKTAFATLVQRHGPMVLNSCRRILHRPQDVEDAFQATFLVLLRNAARHPWREFVGGWLHGVAVRVALRVRSDAARRAAPATRTEGCVVADPLEQMTARELFAALDDELARLPATYREPLVCCFLEGRTQEEAARQLGWSLSTVRRRLERGRKLLHARLVRCGLSLPAVLGAVLLSRGTAAAGMPLPAVPGVASARVAALADGIVKAAVLTPMKATAILLLALGVLAAGAGLAAQHFAAAKPPETPSTASVQPEKPKTEKTESTDLYGDPLPPAALMRMGTVRFRHHEFIGKVAYSPDGKILAAGGYNGVIVLYDPTTGKKLREFEARASQFPALAFAPDGKTLASAGSKTIQVWDVNTGKELCRFDADVSDTYSYRFIVPLVYSPDGTALASVAPDHSVRVWDVKTGKELGKLEGHQDPVSCLAFAPDGKTLFSASGDSTRAVSVRVWAVATGTELRKFSLGDPKAGSQPAPLCFSPDGKTFVYAAHERLPPRWAKNFIDAYAVTFLDLKTGEVSLKLEPLEGRVKAAAFSPNGKTIATMSGVPIVASNLGSEDGYRIKVFDTATAKQLFDFPAYAEHLGQGPCHLTFTPDGKKVAAAATASSLHVWDLVGGREQLEPSETHHDLVKAVRFSPDGRTLASASSDNTIALWDAATGRQRLRLRGHQGEVAAIAFSPDGKLLASASHMNDQTVRIWDTATGKELRCYSVPDVPVGDGTSWGVSTWVAFAANGTMLAAGGTDRKLRLWDVASGKELLNQSVRGLPVPAERGPNARPSWKDDVNNVAFSPDGRVMVLSIGLTLHVVDVAAGERLFQFEKDSQTTGLLALSPDGKTLLCGGRGFSFRLVEVASGKDLRKVDLSETEAIVAVAFSPDGRSIAVSTDYTGGTIRLYDVRTGEQLLRLQGHHSRVNGLTFSPDGTKLASGQQDTTALVWDVSAARRKLPAVELAARDLDRLWADLKDTDPAKAHAALWALVAAPDQAVALLKDRLRPVQRVPADRLRQLIADLDADGFKERDGAARELAKLGIEAEPTLRKALKNEPSLEVSRRVEALLSGLVCQSEMTTDALRQLRAIQVLEQIDSPAVRAVLTSLAEGSPAAPATREAKAALMRLGRLSPAPP